MTLANWLENGWVRRHRTSREEIAGLLGIVDRDLADAKSTISADWRFGIAYNAALKLCTILLYAEGYQGAHPLLHMPPQLLQTLAAVAVMKVTNPTSKASLTRFITTLSGRTLNRRWAARELGISTFCSVPYSVADVRRGL